jgi:hypothetical protein
VRTRVGRAIAAGLWRTKETNVKRDPIDDLIKPPVAKYTGFDWSKTAKLIPNGAANRDKVVASRLQPVKEL